MFDAMSDDRPAVPPNYGAMFDQLPAAPISSAQRRARVGSADADQEGARPRPPIVGRASGPASHLRGRGIVAPGQATMTKGEGGASLHRLTPVQDKQAHESPLPTASPGCPGSL